IFGQTLVSAFQHMIHNDFRDDLPNFLTSIAYFLPPSIAMLWAAMYCYGRRWARRWSTPVVTVVAAACPLAIVLIAWDLSRFLAWSIFAAALVLIGVGEPRLVGVEVRR